MNIQTEAHHAAVAGASGGLSAGVAMAHAQWMANGGTGADSDGVANFGDGYVTTNASGWPVGWAADGSASNTSIANAADCVEVWNGVMQNPPTVATATGSDYRASRSGQVCTYTYQGDTATTRSIAYNASSGGVTVTNPEP
jgi:hypothetical protein